MTNDEKVVLQTTATILRLESKYYYDIYQHNSDAESKSMKDKAFRNYEKYSELNRLARELDIIVGGL